MSFGNNMTFEQLEVLRERYRTGDHSVIWGKTQDEKDSRCLHKACSQCHGTGIRPNGGMCFHAISCPCPKCSFTC